MLTLQAHPSQADGRKGGKKMRRKEQPQAEKILDITANMEGNLSFNDPVNLCINGNFRGSLNSKGKLVIGEKAEVTANIKGEEISVAGRIRGNVEADKKIEILPSGRIDGDVQAPLLSIKEGGILQGRCQMAFDFEEKKAKDRNLMGLRELAEYLELELNVVQKWAASKKIPGVKKDNEWLFEKGRIDKWISEEKSRV